MLGFHRGVGLRGRTGALNPLALEVGGNLAADERAVAGVLNLDRGSRDVRLRIEEGDPLLLRARAARRSIRAAMTALRSASRPASASRAATASGVKTSP